MQTVYPPVTTAAPTTAAPTTAAPTTAAPTTAAPTTAAPTTTLAPSFATFPGGGQVAPGTPIPINVTNLCTNATVTVTATTSTGTSTLGTGVTNASGAASFNVPAPTTPGNYIITVLSTSTGCSKSVSQSLGVVVPTTTVPGGLPPTGSEPMNWVRAGGIAILVGLGLIGAAAVRRRNAPLAS